MNRGLSILSMREAPIDSLVNQSLVGMSIVAGLICFLFAGQSWAAPVRSLAGDELFSSPGVPKFRIEIADPDLSELQKDPLTYVHAAVRVDGQLFKDAAVRLKGRGSFRPLNSKPSFAVKFNEFTPGQKLHGLTKIMLNNSSQDPTYLSEFLAAGLFRDAGVPAARVTHARVELNGRDLGFYVLVEAMNGPFLRQHFENPDGPLYEAYAQDIDQPLDQDHGPPSDQSDLRALLDAARVPEPQRLSRLRAVLDVDECLSFLAVTMLIAQHDSYPNNRNNYRLYRHPAAGRFTIIPHGIDGSFSRNTMSVYPARKYILTKALMTVPEIRQDYRVRLAALFTNIFKLEVMTNRVQAAATRMRQAAMDERERTNIVAGLADFSRRVTQRFANVTRQLAGPEPTPFRFDADGVARLTGWEPQVNTGTADLNQREEGDLATLHVKTGPGISVASWRQRALLPAGRYRFESRVRMVNVASDGTRLIGAALRLSGSQPAQRLIANEAWSRLEEKFVVREDEEEVELVCEFRASNAEAWFDANSLKLVKE